MHSAREYFHTYLQSLDVERAGLPETFQAKLAKALGHYGVTELERSPSSKPRCSGSSSPSNARPPTPRSSTTLLRAGCAEPPPDESLREPAGLALERLVAATQVRFPVVCDLARGVVFAWFAQPLLRRNRARVYADVRRHLRHLDAHPDAPDRAERIAEMVRSTEPLVRLLGQRLVRDDLDNAVMLEVLTRRYYGNKGLTGVRTSEVAGCTFVVAERDRLVRGLLRGGLRRAGRRAARRSRELASGARTPSTPTSISPGRSSRRTSTRWRPRCTRSSARTRCRSRSAGSPPPSRAAAAR